MSKIYGIYDDYTIDFVKTYDEAKAMAEHYLECTMDNIKGYGNSVKLFKDIPSWGEVEQLENEGWSHEVYTVNIVKLENGYVIDENTGCEARAGKEFGSWDWDNDDIEEVEELNWRYMFFNPTLQN